MVEVRDKGEELQKDKEVEQVHDKEVVRRFMCKMCTRKYRTMEKAMLHLKKAHPNLDGKRRHVVDLWTDVSIVKPPLGNVNNI